MHKINEITIPKGEYWLGDPCYVLNDEDYEELIKEENDIKNPSKESNKKNKNFPVLDIGEGCYTVINKHHIVSLYTKYGDGLYEYQEQPISVDSGMIGLVPMALVSDVSGIHHGVRVRLEEDSKINRSEDGTLSFGSIEVYTGDDYEDDYDELDED